MGWLTGAPLKGYRTYIISAIGILTAIVNYLTGSADLVTTIPAILAALGLVTAANH